MRVRSWMIVSLAASATYGATMVGCGSARTSFKATGDAGKPIDASVAADAGPVDGSSLLFDDVNAADIRQCSTDLQKVLDGNGAVVQACNSDQGCSNGKCVSACEAAQASQGNIGCDFVIPTPSFYPSIKPPCFAIFLANAWTKNVQITVTRDGQTYDPTTFGYIPIPGQKESTWPLLPSTGVDPGSVAVLFMSHDPASANGTPLTCPLPPAVTDGASVDGSGIGAAWHVTTDVPVSAYDIMPYGGAKSYLPSAELIVPTTAWGTNYLGIVPVRGYSSAHNGPTEPQWAQIVASQDNTTVTLLPSVDLAAGVGFNAAPQNTPATFLLAAGQYLQWTGTQEMSSTVVSADKPVAFTGGSGFDCYTSNTSTGGGCDSAHQQIPPITALGVEYVGAPYATRRADLQAESIPYRIVGALDDTELTFDPPVDGAPTTLSGGQVVDFEAVGSFVVKAQDKQHPFYVGQVMTGCHVTGGSRTQACLGDEEFVNVLPPAQFLSKYVFFTDPTYGTTNLVFVRAKSNGTFKDVTLDCLGTVTGWQAAGSAGNYEIATVDLIRGGVKNGSCANGPHQASSDGMFGLTVWGLDSFASYAYPAGGNAAPINKVVLPTLPR